MSLKEKRKEVYGFFDENIKPLVVGCKKEDLDEIIDIVRDILKDKKQYHWIVRRYKNTVRISAWNSGLGYMFFMIATPKNEEEYDFDVKYHGSRSLEKECEK